MVDFAKLLEQARREDWVRPGTLVAGPWPEQGVTFQVRRGSFRLPKGLAADPDAFGHELGRRLPPRDMGKLVTTITPEGGEVVVRWRIIRVVAA